MQPPRHKQTAYPDRIIGVLPTASDDPWTALSTGDTRVLFHGRRPRKVFPEPVTVCVAGIAAFEGSTGATEGRLYVLHGPTGFSLQLDCETPPSIGTHVVW
jgi:hypothetical protein